MINTKFNPVITNFKSLVTTNNRYPLTKTQLQIYMEKGYSADTISHICGRTIMYVRHLMSSYKLTPEEFAKTKKLEAQIIELKNQRASINEIIEKTGEKGSVIKGIIANLFPEGYTRAKQATRLDSVQNQRYKSRKTSANSSEEITPMYKKRPNVATRRTASKLKMCSQILSLKEEGYSIKEIAEALNKCEATIKSYLDFCQRKILN